MSTRKTRQAYSVRDKLTAVHYTPSLFVRYLFLHYIFLAMVDSAAEIDDIKEYGLC
jgi:hypothetical protein